MAAPSIDDDDEFDEYNPHPYQGGYDIALTYGHPLPPSPSTCYPISQGSAHLPKPNPPYPPPASDHLHEHSTPLPLPRPPPEPDHRPEPHTPLPLPPPPPESDHRPEPPPTPESSHRPVYDYRPVNYWPWPDFDNFGFWPYRTKECERCCADAEGVSYWHQLKRAGDYLFGYSEGYGEKRIGVDSYGIPIYANKKEDSQAVTVEIEPVKDLKVECYESGNSNGNWFSSYDENNDRGYGYAYNKHYNEHYNEEPLDAQENMIELMLHQQLTYHEAYEEQVYPKLEWWPSSYKEEDRSYGYAYNKHHYEESLHVEENLVEPMLHQQLAYHEVYDEQLYPKLHPSYGEHDNETNFYGNNQYAYERHDKEQSLRVELEPYKPTWSQNLHYVEFFGGESSLAYSSRSSMDNVVEDERSIFGESNSAHGRNSYEQPVCVQLEPYKSTWALNSTFYESYGQEAYQSSWVDCSSKENGAQYFSSLFEYSQFDE